MQDANERKKKKRTNKRQRLYFNKRFMLLHVRVVIFFLSTHTHTTYHVIDSLDEHRTNVIIMHQLHVRQPQPRQQHDYFNTGTWSSFSDNATTT